MSTQLDPAGRPVRVGPVALITPALTGTATSHAPGPGGTRGAAPVAPALAAALAAEGVQSQATVSIEAAREVAGAAPLETRGPSVPERAMRVEVAAPSPGWGQLVLSTDEAGVTSWSFAPEAGRAATRSYLVRSAVPPSDAEAAPHRGFLGAIGRKVIEVLAFRLAEEAIGAVGEHFARRWEEKRRPYALRRFGPADAGTIAPPLTTEQWPALGDGRLLLFVHGTFGRAHAHFGHLPPEVLGPLHERYGGRVLAFDHFTLSHDPRRNVQRLLELVPPARPLSLDVVAFSRGGLVARALAEQAAQLTDRPVDIGRVVFVGTPNAGTILADAEHLGDLLDVYTNLLRLLPDAGVSDVLEVVITVAKLLAVGTVKGLDGLQSMVPDGPFLKQWLNVAGPPATTVYRAVASNFEPLQRGLREFAGDRITDALFKADNDLVVPTSGVFAANGCGRFPVADPLVLDAAAGVGHLQYFAHRRVHERLLEWLRP